MGIEGSQSNAKSPGAPADFSLRLQVAARGNDPERIAEMIAQGADASSRDHVGRTPLMWAASLGHEESVRALLAASDIQARDDDGWNAAMWAADNGRLGCLLLLEPALRGEAGAEKPNPILLSLAAAQGHAACVQALIPHCDAKIADEAGGTPLIWAARAPSPECVKLLLPVSNAQAKTTEGQQSALMFAARKSDPECLMLLLGESNPLDKDCDGQTALMAAAQSGAVECARILAQCGGVRETDLEGGDALSLAVANEESEIADFLASWFSLDRVAQAVEKLGPHDMPQAAARLEANEIRESLAEPVATEHLGNKRLAPRL